MTLRIATPLIVLFTACAGPLKLVPEPTMAAPPGPVDPHVVVEARATVAVADVVAAAAAVRSEAAARGGRVAKDSVEAAAGRAVLSLRVVPEAVEPLFERLAILGVVEDRSITATDVSKTLVDTALRLENLRAALARYQMILAEADTVTEMLEVEAELTRVRGEIEALEGEDAWLRDRVARATVDVTLSLNRTEAVFAPEPKLHPGVRLSQVFFLGEGARSTQAIGASVYFTRHGHLSLDILEDGLLALAGSDLYSDFLGRGRRAFLNPHLGLAAGYARVDSASHLAVAAAAGVELFKSRYVLVDTGVRAVGLFGAGGPKMAIVATLSVNVVF